MMVKEIKKKIKFATGTTLTMTKSEHDEIVDGQLQRIIHKMNVQDGLTNCPFCNEKNGEK